MDGPREGACCRAATCSMRPYPLPLPSVCHRSLSIPLPAPRMATLEEGNHLEPLPLSRDLVLPPSRQPGGKAVQGWQQASDNPSCPPLGLSMCAQTSWHTIDAPKLAEWVLSCHPLVSLVARPSHVGNMHQMKAMLGIAQTLTASRACPDPFERLTRPKMIALARECTTRPGGLAMSLAGTTKSPWLGF